LRALEREAKSQRDLLESYLARYRDVTARESPDAVPADARILSQAVPPSTPYFPKKLPIVLIAALAAFICSATLIAISELVNGDNVRRATMPVKEVMPEPVAAKTPSQWIGQTEHPKPPKTESVERSRERRLAALAHHISGLGKGIVVVTGTVEGKLASDIAIGLAREVAQEGPRVLLLDMDAEQTPAVALANNPTRARPGGSSVRRCKFRRGDPARSGLAHSRHHGGEGYSRFRRDLFQRAAGNRARRAQPDVRPCDRHFTRAYAC
jgi:hypothetical protein